MVESSDKVTGRILGYLRGPNTQYTNYVLIHLENVDNKYADRFLNRKVKAVDNYGNVYLGKLLRRRSRRKPVFTARFKPNIPGQMIGSIVVVE